jgi:hypothetical protein
MLGTSSNIFDPCIARVFRALNPKSVIDIGAGKGKLGKLGATVIPETSFTALQIMFDSNDRELLKKHNYCKVIDEEILAYVREGFDERYSLATICDVLEHFLYSDAISIVKFLAYRCDWILLVWPSKHPQDASTHQFDRHRFSLSPAELFNNNFDIVRYEQTGFSSVPFVHSYHLALIRGDMNLNTAPIF